MLPVQYFAKLQRIEIKMEHFGLLVAVYQQQNNFQAINKSPGPLEAQIQLFLGCHMSN